MSMPLFWAQFRMISNWRRNSWTRIAVFVLVYVVSVNVGMVLVTQPEGLSVIWPASGVAIAALVLSSQRERPILLAVIFLTNLFSNLAFKTAFLPSLGFAVANTLEPAVGMWVIQNWFDGKLRFVRMRDVIGLVTVALLANGITAGVGALVPVLNYGASFVNTWVTWWVLDAYSILILMPLIITWGARGSLFSSSSLANRWESVFWLAILGISNYFMFGVKNVNIYLEPRPYMLVPLFIWTTLRFSPRASSAVILLTSMIGLGCTAAGLGSAPLGGITTREQLVAVQGFFAVISITVLMLSATIHERDIASQEIQQSEERFRALVENGTDAVTLLDANGTILYEGPTVEHLTGYKAEERIGRSGLGNLHPDDLPSIQKVMGQVMSTPGQSFRAEFRSVRKDGAVWWTEGVATNLLHNPSVQAIVINYRDITERKRAVDALRTSEQKYRMLFENMTNGFALHEMIYDENGKPCNYSYLAVNPAFEKLTGVPVNALMGKTVLDVMPNTEDHWIQTFGKVAETGEPTAYLNYARELGKYYDTWVFSPQRGQFAVIFNDVTERKVMEIERGRLMTELERKNKELESIVYVASHDLRSPLVNIQGFSRSIYKHVGQLSELLNNAETLEEFRAESQSILAERLPKALRFIETGASKMDVLIDGLLRVSRAGRAQLNPSQLDTRQIFQTILETMSFQIEKSGAHIELQERMDSCFGDKNQINQVFSNLLDNALKYRDPKRPLKITISSEKRGSNIVYTIADSGVGIAPEYQDKIWELFHRLEDDASIPGEGLGLTITRRIVERHGGSIWVESQPGVGSRFFVQLPAGV